MVSSAAKRRALALLALLLSMLAVPPTHAASELHYTTDLQGIDDKARGKIDLAIALEARRPLINTEFQVTWLSETFGEAPIKLLRLLAVKIGKDQIVFSELGLSLRSGRIEGAGTSQGQAVSLGLRGSKLPLRPFAAFAADEEMALPKARSPITVPMPPPAAAISRQPPQETTQR